MMIIDEEVWILIEEFERAARNLRNWTIALLVVIVIGILGAYAILNEFDQLLRKATPPPAQKPVTLTDPSGRIEIREMTVTAYTCGPESTGKRPGDPEYRITTNGHKIAPGEKVIAAPPEIPFGTEIVVPGYGKAIVQDRGGKIYGDRLDIHIEHLEAADAWGVQRLPVVILRKGATQL